METEKRTLGVFDNLVDFITVELLGCAMARAKPAPPPRIPVQRPGTIEEGDERLELHDTYAHARNLG